MSTGFPSAPPTGIAGIAAVSATAAPARVAAGAGAAAAEAAGRLLFFFIEEERVFVFVEDEGETPGSANLGLLAFERIRPDAKFLRTISVMLLRSASGLRTPSWLNAVTQAGASRSTMA